MNLSHDSRTFVAAYRKATHTLFGFYLSPVVEYCAEQRIPANKIATVILSGLLQSWVNELLRTDQRLTPIRSVDRDALVAEYRILDRQLRDAAAADIIAAVNSRAPTDLYIGQPKIIQHWGQRKRGSLPSKT